MKLARLRRGLATAMSECALIACFGISCVVIWATFDTGFFEIYGIVFQWISFLFALSYVVVYSLNYRFAIKRSTIATVFAPFRLLGAVVVLPATLLAIVFMAFTSRLAFIPVVVSERELYHRPFGIGEVVVVARTASTFAESAETVVVARRIELLPQIGLQTHFGSVATNSRIASVENVVVGVHVIIVNYTTIDGVQGVFNVVRTGGW